MDSNSRRKRDEKIQPRGSMAGAGSSKTPPFGKKEVEESQGAGSSKTPPFGKEEVEESQGAGSSRTPYVLKDAQLLVKLKNLKSAEVIGDDRSGVAVRINYNIEWDDSPRTAVVNNKENFSHFCKECHKGFVNGKALGGHMSSAHVQAKDHLKKLKTRKFAYNLLRNYDADQEKLTCRHCFKEFISPKSLYGHMRLHPERPYRGMNRPPSKEPSGGHLTFSYVSYAAGDEHESLVTGTMPEADEIQTGGGGWDAGLKGVSETIHDCNICGKTSPSGWALGGHKRRHYTGSSSQKGSSSQVASPSSGGTNQKSERKGLEFDLNVVPDEDEDPNLGGYGC